MAHRGADLLAAVREHSPATVVVDAAMLGARGRARQAARPVPCRFLIMIRESAMTRERRPVAPATVTTVPGVMVVARGSHEPSLNLVRQLLGRMVNVRGMPGFAVVEVSAWEVINPEPLGREAKIWLREPGAPPHSRERDWLFKPVVVPSHGHPQGEDWAEKIVCELGGLLGVPCADVEFAERNGVIGSISRNVTPTAGAFSTEATSSPA